MPFDQRQLNCTWNEYSSYHNVDLTLKRLEKELTMDESVVQRIKPAFINLLNYFKELIYERDEMCYSDNAYKYPDYYLRQIREVESAIKDTIDLLFIHTLSVNVYQSKAQKTYKKSSPALQVLGGLMIALSIAIIAVGVPLVPVSVGFAISVGTITAALGCGLFARGRAKGLSKLMGQVAADFAKEIAPEPITL